MDANVVVIGADALGLTTALHCAMSGRSVAVVERHTAGSQASGRAAGLFKSVQADELRTRLARRSITKAVTFADWAGTPLAVARPGSFLIARTAQHREFLQRELAGARIPVGAVRHQLLITAPTAQVDPATALGSPPRSPLARPSRPGSPAAPRHQACPCSRQAGSARSRTMTCSAAGSGSTPTTTTRPAADQLGEHDIGEH